MDTLNVAEAKKRFSELLGRVAYRGESVVVTRRGKPMARLVPVESEDEPYPVGFPASGTIAEGVLEERFLEPRVLESVIALQLEEHRPLGQIVSELVEEALARRRGQTLPRFSWSSKAMGSRIDLADKDALHAALDEPLS